MRLVFTTPEYVYAGRPRPGFPLILGEDMRPAQPFHDFLHHTLLARGKKLDEKTWDTYGRRLWDFASYLHANELVWDQPFDAPGEGVVVRYRDWSTGDLELNPKTVNARLRFVAKFYEWARNEGRIDKLPFGYDDLRVLGIDHDLKHLDGGSKVVSKLDILQDEWEEEPAFLSADEIKVARLSCTSPSRALLFDLMVRVGLRSCEARTFPLKYVFNPAMRKGCRPGTMIEVRLDPKDMEIKFKKSRIVHIPFSLMESLHQYTLFERNRLASCSDITHQALVLTVNGRPFSKDAVGDFCRDLAKKTGFRVAALMLRHSYAIHTLIRLRLSKEYQGEPLLYVRDRLGHESVQTTMTYLKQIERLTGAVALAMSDEFDQIFGAALP